MILCLSSGCSARTPPQPEAAAANGAPAGREDAGARIYEGNCIACHQQDAHGIAGVYPSLAGSPVVLGDPKALALWVIKGRRPSSLPAGRYPTSMSPFGWLKAADAAALFTYLRTSFGNSASPVDAAAVAEALDAHAGASPP